MNWLYNKVHDYLHVNDKLFNTLFVLYGNAALSLSNIITNLYETNPLARYFIKLLNFSTKYVKSIALQHRLEPMAESWVSISSLKNNNNFVYDYYEYYSDCLYNSNEEVLDTRLATYIDTYNIYKSIVVSDLKNKDTIVTLKYNDQYVHRICNKNAPDLLETNIETLELSSTRFLSIEYTHPDMKTPIILSLEKGHYVNNNEILSPAFILRLLEYQPHNYVFDMDYKLKIMDNNINMFGLTFDKYIVLTADSYRILSS